MENIRRLAMISVARGCGFAALAIVTTMLGLSFDLLLMTRTGAVLFTIAAVVLQFLAWLAPTRNPKRTEVWAMLDPQDAPPPAVARQVIGGILAETHGKFARWAFAGGLALWLTSAALRLVGN